VLGQNALNDQQLVCGFSTPALGQEDLRHATGSEASHQLEISEVSRDAGRVVHEAFLGFFNSGTESGNKQILGVGARAEGPSKHRPGPTEAPSWRPRGHGPMSVLGDEPRDADRHRR
jgi:hypothetical protein